jgi:hypothetical protein
MELVAVTVRRHAVRQAINMRRLWEEGVKSNTQIVYYVVNVSKWEKMRLHHAYQVQFGPHQSPVDGIIPLIEGAPLLVTKNVNRTLGTFSL